MSYTPGCMFVGTVTDELAERGGARSNAHGDQTLFDIIPRDK